MESFLFAKMPAQKDNTGSTTESINLLYTYYVIPPADWYFIYMAPSARLADFVISVMDLSMSRNSLNQNPRYL